jgi:hypothetical protein
LTAGGSLTGNVSGYFDDSHPEVTVRWTVADITVTQGASTVSMKTITVRAIAKRQVVGERKEITMTTERGNG